MKILISLDDAGIERVANILDYTIGAMDDPSGEFVRAFGDGPMFKAEDWNMLYGYSRGVSGGEWSQKMDFARNILRAIGVEVPS